MTHRESIKLFVMSASRFFLQQLLSRLYPALIWTTLLGLSAYSGLKMESRYLGHWPQESEVAEELGELPVHPATVLTDISPDSLP